MFSGASDMLLSTRPHIKKPDIVLEPVRKMFILPEGLFNKVYSGV
jgi:hypothetical protein